MSLASPVDGAKRCVERRGHRGGEKAARAARGEKVADGSERLGRGLHHVVAGGAVNMHVEECREQAWRRENPERCASLGNADEVASGDGVDLAVFDGDERVVDADCCRPRAASR